MTPSGAEVWDLVWQTGSALVTLAALAGVAWWLLAPRVKSWFGALIASVRATETHTEQLTPNGGTNVADKVDRAVDLSEQTLTAVNDLNSRMDASERRHETTEHRHEKDMAELWRAIAQMPLRGEG